MKQHAPGRNGWLVLGLLAALGCASTSRPGGASGGTDGEEGGSGGTTSTGGSGGKATGGSEGKATGGSGGMAPGGTGGGTGGGQAGSGGAAGAPVEPDAGAGPDAATSTPMASAGCGKPNPPVGNQMAGGGSYIVSIPPGYDPMKPYPLGFAFHGYGRTNVHCRDDDCPDFQKAMGDKAILVYMKSIGPGWEDNLVKNLPYFDAVLMAMKAGYCVDQSKVFIAGTSSGAAFTNVVACKFGDQLAAVAPVAGPRYDMDCKGTPAAIVVHGVKDNLQNGIGARDTYIKRNGCTTTSVPDVAMVHAKVVATTNAFECVSYQGCTKAPVRWCEHNIGGYNGTTHGWPPIASPEIWNFVQMLK